jgi:hypothetical protein
MPDKNQIDVESHDRNSILDVVLLAFGEEDSQKILDLSKSAD